MLQRCHLQKICMCCCRLYMEQRCTATYRALCCAPGRPRPQRAAVGASDERRRPDPPDDPEPLSVQSDCDAPLQLLLPPQLLELLLSECESDGDGCEPPLLLLLRGLMLRRLRLR